MLDGIQDTRSATLKHLLFHAVHHQLLTSPHVHKVHLHSSLASWVQIECLLSHGCMTFGFGIQRLAKCSVDIKKGLERRTVVTMNFI